MQIHANEPQVKKLKRAWEKRLLANPRKVHLPYIEKQVLVMPPTISLLIGMIENDPSQRAINVMQSRCRGMSGEIVFSGEIIAGLRKLLSPVELIDIEKTINVDILDTELFVKDLSLENVGKVVDSNPILLILMMMSDHLQQPMYKLLDMPLWERDAWHARFNGQILFFKKSKEG